jgi:biotin carboxyl carrier protein
MTFEVEMNGRTRAVSIERAGGASTGGAERYRITVDGQSSVVDAQRTARFGLSLVFVEAGHAAVSVQLAPGQAPGERLAYLGGRMLAVGVNARRTGRAAAETGATAHGEQKVVSPMPGRVVRVLVAPGDAVQVRQPVIVVEAMKMENELRSPKAGTVKDVAVNAGASVEAGRVLVVID